jgi:hypothetical protein
MAEAARDGHRLTEMNGIAVEIIITMNTAEVDPVDGGEGHMREIEIDAARASIQERQILGGHQEDVVEVRPAVHHKDDKADLGIQNRGISLIFAKETRTTNALWYCTL